jgi:hypothetical protein
MKQYILLIISLFCIIACKNADNSSERSNANISDTVQKLNDSLIRKDSNKLPDGYEYAYTFTNSVIAEKLYVKKGPINKKLEVPENLEFKLILQNPNYNASNLTLAGVATLGSPNESFSDKNEPNGGDYFASDYSYRWKDCKLKILIDVAGFAASIVSLQCSDSVNFDKKYKLFFPEEYNSTNVLKREK